MRGLKVLFAVFTFTFLCGVVWAKDVFDGFVQSLKSSLKPSEKVAVGVIYDGESYSITSYSNFLRDKLVAALNRHGIRAVPRKDIVLLMDELEITGSIGRIPRANVVVLGSYYLKYSKEGYRTELFLKAVRVKSEEIVLSRDYSLKLSFQELKLLTNVVANAMDLQMESLDPIPLEAQLNKKCFRPGEKAYITVKTRPGAYIYIFNVAGNLKVARIYPNRLFPEKPLATGHLTFPPPDFKELALVMLPLEGEDSTYESFYVVASPEPLPDEVFPVPENRMIKKAPYTQALQKLIKQKEVKVIDLPYIISEKCK